MSESPHCFIVAIFFQVCSIGVNRWMMFRGWREKDQSYFSRFFTKKIVGKSDVKKMERKKSPLPSKIDAADRRVG